jgi:hypothetical protein
MFRTNTPYLEEHVYILYQNIYTIIQQNMYIIIQQIMSKFFNRTCPPYLAEQIHLI